jgi:hypothetical protein
VIRADADSTYELGAIPRLLVPLVEGKADLVLGQRLNDATTATMPWLHRHVGTPAITYLVRRATRNRLAIRDSQSGFRAFRREQILNLNLSSTGMEFASEMLIRSAWADLRIEEVNTKYAERVGESKLNTFSDGLRHLRQILLLSPETAALIPGLTATAVACVLWVITALTGSGVGQAGSLNWTLDGVAEVLSILGPLVFCSGLVLRYRAESIGLRTAHVKTPLRVLIRRFFTVGFTLVSLAIVGVCAMLIYSRYYPNGLTKAATISITSLFKSSLIVGIVLSAAPLISPFLTTAPRVQLPTVEER